MREQIIDFWKISFGDTDDFISLWFERVYKDDQTFVIRQNGKIVSALQILPYEMTYYGTTIPIGYICGVCTLPSERGKGYMSQLMHQAITAMQNHHYALAVLIPATPGLFDLYRRFEFVNAFDYSIEVIQSDNLINNLDSGFRIVSHKSLSTDSTYVYYNTKQNERDISVIHSAYQFETILRDWTQGGCELWVALANEQPVGLAFTDPIKDEILSIREIMCDNTTTKNQFAKTILNHYQLQSAKLRVPSTLSDSIPYGMARIIDKDKMIDLYRSSHTCFPFFDFYNMDIPLLTQVLLNYDQRKACMNLMLD